MGNQMCTGDDVGGLNIHLLKGNDHFHKKEYKAAVEEYTKAITDNPKDADAYNNRALCYKHLAEAELALADLNQVIRLKPHDPQVYNNRGIAYKILGRYEEALVDFRQAIDMDERYAAPLFHCGQIHYDQRHYEDAAKDFSRGIQLDERQADPYLKRGMCYLKLHRHDQCVKDFNKVFEFNQRTRDTFYYRAYAHYQLQSYELTLADCNQYYKIVDNSGEIPESQVVELRANAHIKLGRFEEARKDLEEGLKHKPNHPVLLFDLAYVNLNLNQHKEASVHFENGINSFGQDSLLQLVQKYGIDESTVGTIDRDLSRFSEFHISIDKIQNLAQANENHQFTDEAKRLKRQINEVFIPVFAQRDGQKALNIDSLQKRIRDLSDRNQASINSALRKILKEIKKIDAKKTFGDERIQGLINDIHDQDRHRYYSLLYHCTLNHLVSYRVLYSGYFKDHADPFDQVPAILAEISCYQSITQHYPGFEELVKVPFKIIEKHLHQQLSVLARYIGNKIGTSKLNSDDRIVELLLHIVGGLINDKDYNESLKGGLGEHLEDYLLKIWAEVSINSQQVSSELLIKGTAYTPLEKVVLSNVILITKMLYQIDMQDFHKLADNKEQFFKTVRNSLPPKQQTVQEQGLAHEDVVELGSPELPQEIVKQEVEIRHEEPRPEPPKHNEDFSAEQMGSRDNSGCCAEGQCLIM